jgi:dienelactone hydrolase
MIDRWDEAAAANDDGNKLSIPCELGASLAFPDLPPDADVGLLQAAVRAQLHRPTAYYGPLEPQAVLADACFDDGLLAFPSTIQTGDPGNDVAYARIMESSARREAIVLVPHWNAPPDALMTLAKLLHWRGYSVAVLILPHHHQRKRAGSTFADYFVSANLGRTIRAVRQAVFDVYGVISWLQSRGHSRLSVLGASLGSCIAGLAGAFDPRIQATLLLVTAGSFADVVWTGRATRHIGRALQEAVTLPELRAIWSLISLDTFCDQLVENQQQLLIVSAKRDQVVLPVYTKAFLAQLHAAGATVSHMALPCGHYSMGMAPFNALAALRIMAFLHSVRR